MRVNGSLRGVADYEALFIMPRQSWWCLCHFIVETMNYDEDAGHFAD